MSSDPAIREETFPYFVNEATDLLQEIEQELLSLREDQSANRVHSLMRSAHTLKGAAATVGLETVKHVCHVLEDVFRGLYNPDIVIDDEIEALLFEGYDCLRTPLMAELNGTAIDDSDIMNRAAAVISRIQEKLGDLFDSEAAIPTAQELGFDVVQSMFEAGVEQRLSALEAVLETASEPELIEQTQLMAEVFSGLAESLQLPGFGQIAQTTLSAFSDHPQLGTAIVRVAYRDFRAGQSQVLAGDRAQGGQPSAELLALAAGQAARVTSPGAPDVVQSGPVQSGDRNPNSEQEAREHITAAAPDPLSAGLENLFGDLPELSFEPSPGQPEDLPAETAAPLESLNNLFGGVDLSAVEVPADPDATPVQGKLPTSDQAEALQQPDLQSVSVQSANLRPPASQPAEAVARATTQSEVSTAPASKAMLTQRPGPRSSQNSTTKISTAKPAGSNRTAQVNVRVGLDQVLRLDHLVGELLTNQTQSNEEDDQVRSGIQELLDQLRQHRRTLSDLQTAAQKIGLDDWELEPRLKSNPLKSGSGDPDVPRDPSLPAQRNAKPTPQKAEQETKQETKAQPRLALTSPVSVPQLSLAAQFDALELDRYSDLHILTQKALNESVQLEIVIEAVEQMTKKTRQTRDLRHRLFCQLRDDLAAVRLKPVGELFKRFPRVIQQLSTTYNKKVNLTLTGSHVLLDKVTLDSLYDSLLHLVRNGFDHGIEPAEARAAAGKPAEGSLELKAYQQGNRTFIEICDDGGGIDPEKIAAKAIEKGLIDATETTEFSRAEILEFLFHPGFSTASQLSELSGRGVGLDVVRAQIEKLEGSISIRSEVGQGTTFVLSLPLSVTVTKQLICKSHGSTYAIAADAVQQVVLPRQRQLRALGDGRLVFELSRGGSEPEQIPVQPLAHLLQYAQGSPGSSSGQDPLTQPILLLSTPEGQRGIQVDQVIGEQEVSIRSLGSAIAAPDYIQGCTVLGDSKLALAIEPAILLTQTYESAQARSIAIDLQSKANSPSLPRLLIVDDSLTQRRTLERTLQTVGYEVTQAEDGLDALIQLKQNSQVDLIVCDLEMPRMNGFEFISQTRTLPGISEIPIVILTSRSGGKYHQLAIELGASAFLSKPYTDYELLNQVSELLAQRGATGKALALA